ncbi:MAG: efflux RND transporter periplasmic adaptor subunit, partial [Nitrospirales bacterium]|nr:efflux RND transporter periplasmic adaptor subunit [Nitrospirales bacterium]
MTTTHSVKSGWLVIAAALALGACGDQSGGPPAKPVRPSAKGADKMLVQAPAVIRERLRVELVTSRVVPEVVTAPGEVALDLKRVAKVSPRIEGKVEHLSVFLGDRVRVGQPLAAIGSPRLDELVQEYLV